MTDPMSPLELRPGLTARNRVWLAPLTNQQSHPDGSLSDAEIHFLSLRSEGGFGLVSTAAAYVAQDGKSWSGELGVHDEAMLPGLTRLAGRLHAGGALACAQLFHGGLRAAPEVSGVPLWSASEGEVGGHPVRSATDEDLARVIGQFASAAGRCARAGFDAVEVHGAHGYLLTQFQSATQNQRRDAWGRDVQGRMRLTREVTRAVRAAAPSLAVAVRVSPEDFGNAQGMDVDEVLALADGLVDDGMDVLHLSLWRAEQPTRKHPDRPTASLFREVLGERARIVVAGNHWSLDEVQASLDRGADAVALGRSAIANPDWPRRAQAGEPIVRPPLTPDQLRARGLSDPFVEYMRKWAGFVA